MQLGQRAYANKKNFLLFLVFITCDCLPFMAKQFGKKNKFLKHHKHMLFAI